MTTPRTLLPGVQRLADGLHLICAYVFLPLMTLVVCLDVIGRYIFNSPIGWASDLMDRRRLIMGLSALGAVVILLVIAVLSARTTMYSITDRRVVMRIGMALPVTLNIPFEGIDGASLAEFSDKSGDIALSLNHNGRLGYLVLWPHARPWRWPAPRLRAWANPAAAGPPRAPRSTPIRLHAG